jgi:hypothetical protein
MALGRLTSVRDGARARRRLGWGAAAGALALVLTAAAPAGAALNVATLKATAQGEGLTISAGGQAITLGTSTVAATGEPSVTATAQGEATPAIEASSQATVTNTGGVESQPQLCATPSLAPLPAPVSSVLSVQAACASSQSALDPSGLPSGMAKSTLGALSLNASPLLSQVIPVTSPVVSTIGTIFGKVPTLPGPTTTLEQVLNQLLGVALSNDTVSISVGASTSTLSSSATSMTATASATGTQIGILPGAGPNGAPLVQLQVAPNTSTAGYTSAGGFTSSSTAALLTVTLNLPGVPAQTQAIAPGQSDTVLAGTPLQSTIAVGAGAHQAGATSSSSSAAGVDIDLLQGVGASSATAEDGGVLLHVGTASTSLADAPPTPAPTAPPAAAPPAVTTTLPVAAAPPPTAVHTGAWWAGSLPLVGAAALLGLVLVTGPRNWTRLATRIRRAGPPG